MRRAYWLIASLLLSACPEDNTVIEPSVDGSTGDPMDGSVPNDLPSPDDRAATSDRADAVSTACSADRPCATGQACLDGRCVTDHGGCTSNNDCPEDSRCVMPLGRCVPWDPGGVDMTCTRDVRPGIFAPSVQCRFSEAPMGDPFPAHVHVLPTPMVADLKVYRAPDDPVRPSIVAVFDDGVDGSSEEPTGLLRVLDGRTCALQDNLSEQMVSHSSPPVIADLDGDGTPEIVAFKAGGGLVAFRYQFATGADAGARRGAWRVMWRSTMNGMPYNPTGGGWSGPTVADLDDDGRPEVFRHGAVFNGQTGALLGGNEVRDRLATYSNGAFSVLLDVDEDGQVELVTGAGVYAWDAMRRAWTAESYYVRSGCTGMCGEGHIAVADLGDYTSARFTDGRIPEIAVVATGTVRIDTIDGRTVFGPVALPGGGTGGPPTVADFDGDGRAEIAVAGATAYSVIDPDCRMSATARSGGRCETMTTNGVLWSRPSQDMSSNVTGSTSFDFEGDGRVEAVYADECFARVYDGRTGTVLFSQHHSSCTWYENPVVADVDGDLRAEIVVGSNFNCGSATTGIPCPGVGARSTDVQFAGIRCATNDDCPSASCVEGFCRCTMDTQCCPPGGAGECTYVCAAPPAGTPGAGNTCRASRPVGVRGIRVYSDIADRWVGSRMIWNQHTYNVTNVTDDARIPRTSAVMNNWRDPTLNNFRTNVQGAAGRMASPDATAGGGRVECLPEGGARIVVRACNRGTAPLPDGLPVGVYNGDPSMGGQRVCVMNTPRQLASGECAELTCLWMTPPTNDPVTLRLVADDGRTRSECYEGNNLATVRNVVCRPPG